MKTFEIIRQYLKYLKIVEIAASWDLVKVSLGTGFNRPSNYRAIESSRPRGSAVEAVACKLIWRNPEDSTGFLEGSSRIPDGILQEPLK